MIKICKHNPFRREIQNQTVTVYVGYTKDMGLNLLVQAWSKGVVSLRKVR